MRRNEIKTKESNLTINETAKSYLVRIYDDKKNLLRPALDYKLCDYSGNYVCQISEVIKNILCSMVQ